MKKYISMFMVALAATFTFVSCDTETDEKAGGTAVEKMAGLWEVKVDVVDEQGIVLGKVGGTKVVLTFSNLVGSIS